VVLTLSCSQPRTLNYIGFVTQLIAVLNGHPIYFTKCAQLFWEFANQLKGLVTHMHVVTGFEKLSFREVSEQTVTAL